MTYSCRYKKNPGFPYKKTTYSPFFTDSKKEKKETSNIFDVSFFTSLLSPIESLLGRKIHFDDILLVALIYIIFTEKNSDNNTLLLCLIFILLG